MTASTTQAAPLAAGDRVFMEHGNQFTKWKLVREDSLQVTLEVVESMGLLGRPITVDQAELKKRFYEVPRG